MNKLFVFLFIFFFGIPVGALAQQSGEVVARYYLPESLGMCMGVAWDGEQVWVAPYNGKKVCRFNVTDASNNDTLQIIMEVYTGYNRQEGLAFKDSESGRIFVGSRYHGGREQARIVEVDEQTSKEEWSYSEGTYLWPDGSTHGNYKDPDGCAWDGENVYYVVKGDHNNLGKSSVTLVRYSDKSILKRFWLASTPGYDSNSESVTDVTWAGGFLIYKPQWHGSYHNYPANNFIILIDVATAMDNATAQAAKVYEITKIPDSGLLGCGETFVSWGCAHDGVKYIYVTRGSLYTDGDDKQSELLKIYCPISD